MRHAYAIEYDCCDPTELAPSLEVRRYPAFYGAGQFNGTSGTKRRPGTGLVAGSTLLGKVQGKPPLVLDRSSSYIGT